MPRIDKTVSAVVLMAVFAVAGCSQQPVNTPSPQEILDRRWEQRTGFDRSRTSLFDSFRSSSNQQKLGRANRYIWTAALETLDFLPVETVDPFSGLIVTGFGTPPGGATAYRATILVDDPALDARSLNVALVSRGGPVDAATVRAVEDAILTRARQLRMQDSKL